ncbi:MAG: single-stranded DNA-binding protein [Immundisolibacter sp.]|uniref:single-stranded DNA-binding protein n=1 Tax=Immundisolibacter sp. TaxID=1934948 RepID=UPI003EE4223D
MNGIEAHFTGRLGKDAELRQTKAGKAMTVLSVVVNNPDSDAGTWCAVLAFEELADRLAGLTKGAELYAKGKLKAELYTPQSGEPRVSLTLLATHAEPLALERKPKTPRTRREPSPCADEPFDDALGRTQLARPASHAR